MIDKEKIVKKIASKDAVEELLAFGPDVISKFCAVLDLLGNDARKVKEFWDLWEKL